MKLKTIALVCALTLGTGSVYADGLGPDTPPNANATWSNKAPHFVVPQQYNVKKYQWDFQIVATKLGQSCQLGDHVDCHYSTQTMKGVDGSHFNQLSDTLHTLLGVKDGYMGGYVTMTVHNTETNTTCDFLQHVNLSQYKDGQTVTLNPEACTASL